MYFSICVFYYCVLVVSHRCVSLLVRVWALDVWGEWVNEVGFFLSFLNFLFG